MFGEAVEVIQVCFRGFGREGQVAVPMHTPFCCCTVSIPGDLQHPQQGREEQGGREEGDGCGQVCPSAPRPSPSPWQEVL